MPAMPRPDGKAKKIAYAIIGKPSNLAQKKNKKLNALRELMLYQDTARVKGAY